jgi:hypothetical protein
MRLWKNNKTYLKIDKFLETNLDRNLMVLFNEKDLISKEILNFFKVEDKITEIIKFLSSCNNSILSNAITNYFSIRERLLKDLKDSDFSLRKDILPYKETEFSRLRYNFISKGISEIDPKFYKFHSEFKQIKSDFDYAPKWDKTFNLDTILNLIDDYKNNFVKKGKIVQFKKDEKFEDVLNITIKEKEIQKLNKKINIRTKISNTNKGKNNVFRTTLQLG